VSAHAEFLRVASKDADLAAKLKSDYRQADLSEQDRRMLEFVEKLTLCPWLIVRADIAMLRNAGFPDSTILHIVLGCAHFNYLNRMADGIGIRFEYQSEVPESNPLPSGPLSQALQNFSSGLEPPSRALAWIAFPEREVVPCGSESLRDLYRLISYNPEALALIRDWRRYHLKGTPSLDGRVRSQLALYISGLNHCDYSSYYVKRQLEDLGEPYACTEILAAGEIPSELSARERLLFAHARRLTQEPPSTREEHLDELRDAGLDDHAILQLTMLCSYLSFENRAALGLGVQIESNLE
jgi:alkylhydroperoxidase family enzyme